jgi:hypothetical protein
VYVFAPEEEGQFQPGRCSRWWLHKSLEALDQDLRALGSRLLCFRAADSLSLLAALAARLGAQAVLFNHLYDPISMVRDNEVKAGLVAAGFYCQSFNADILREPWETLDSAGRPFTSYDAFWTAHCRLPYPPPPPLPMPAAMPPLPAGLGLEAGAVELAELCIMTPEEEMSNIQLDYHVSAVPLHRLPMHRCQCTAQYLYQGDSQAALAPPFFCVSVAEPVASARPCASLSAAVPPSPSRSCSRPAPVAARQRGSPPLAG